MSRVPLRSQTLNILAGRLAMPVGAFLLLVFLGQVSDEILGQYALVTTYYFVLQTLPMMGLMPFYMREVARHPENAGQYYMSFAWLMLINCVVINGALWLAMPYTEYDPAITSAIRLVGLAVIPGILVFLGEITLTSLQRSRPVLYISVFENTLRLVASITVVYQGYGIVPLILILLVTRCLSFLLYFGSLKTQIPSLPLFAIDRTFLRKACAVMPVFLLNTTLALVLSRLDFIILSVFSEVSLIGFYAIGYRLFEISTIAVNAVLSAIYPTLSRLWHLNRPQFRWRVRVFLSGFLLISIIVATIGFSFADLYVSLLFSNQYPFPVFISQMFMILIMIYSLDYSLSQILNAMDLQRRDTLALSVSTPVYFLLLCLLVPSQGITGAYVATALTIAVQLVIRFIFVQQAAFALFSAKEVLTTLTLLTTLILTALTMTDAVFSQKLLFAVFCIFLSVMALGMVGLLKPFRAMALFYSRQAMNHGDISSGKALLSYIAYDFLRHHSWFKNKYRNQSIVVNFSFTTVLLLRLNRYLLLNNFSKCSRLISCLSHFVTKSDFRPTAKIGPGLVLDSPTASGISGQVGHNATCFAHTAIALSGYRDVGFGTGQPVIGNHLILKQRAYILGGILIPDYTCIKAHAQLDKPRQLSEVTDA